MKQGRLQKSLRESIHVLIGKKLARHVFSKRGNHSEIHLSEVELAAMLAVAAEVGAADDEDLSPFWRDR